MKKNRIYYIAAIFAVVLLLGSCNLNNKADTPKAATVPGDISTQIAVSAKPYEGPVAAEMYNYSGKAQLRIDGEGGFLLSVSGLSLCGTYTAYEDEIVLRSGGEELRAYPSGEGYVLSGMAGIFLPLEEKESFSELGVIARSDREYIEESGGTYRLSDYVLQLALRYPASMSAPENLVADAVVIWDKALGYVTGRNVTEEFSGSAESFMESYMREKVLADFRQLYGREGSFETVELLSEGIAGRLASAEGIISGAEEKIYVKCIMYTSTYSDGTVNYICKSFYAPEGDQGSLSALTNSVVNMTAVRRK